MGYGLLVVGYTAYSLLSITLYGWAIRLVGCVLMGIGLYKLRDYFPSYMLSFITTIALFALALAEGVCDISLLLAPENALLSTLLTVVRYIRDGGVYLFNIFLLLSTFFAFGHVDLSDRKVSAVTDLCAVVLGGVLYVLSAFGIVSPDVVFAVQIVWTVMIIALLFGCYMRICPEGDEDMPRKRSRLPFVNKIGDALEKKERESAERAQRQIEEKKKKKNSKKRSSKK